MTIIHESDIITPDNYYVNPNTCTLEEVSKEKHILFRYIRYYSIRRSPYPNGVLLALVHPIEPLATIGISLCHKDDKFDKLTGVRLALKRALRPEERYTICLPKCKSPIDFRYDFDDFIHAVGRYFKGLPIVWPNNITILY